MNQNNEDPFENSADAHATITWPELSARVNPLLGTSSLAPSVFNAALAAMLHSPGAVHERFSSGYGRFEMLEVVLAQRLGAALVRSETDSSVEVVYAGRGAVARLRGYDDDLRLWVASTDRSRLVALFEELSALVTKRPSHGRVAVLAMNSSKDIVVEHLERNGDWRFEPDNYTDEVGVAFGHIREDLRSTAPCGRLVLLSGPPGTGKSHFLRALVSEVDALFLFVAPSLMGRVSAPEVIAALLEQRHRKAPMVLILEDADQVLVTRDAGSLGMVSDLCNLSDGFLAETIDLRIVATTNAPRLSLDEAVGRPGRLCSYVEFAPLPWPKASDVHRRLTGIQMPCADPEHLTLAEIYRMARGAGWAPPGRRDQAAGF